MSHNSLYPSFVRINYTTAYAPHSQTVPTTTVSNDAGDWQFHPEDGGTVIGVDDAVIAWIGTMRQYYPASTVFTDATLFTMATPTATPVPVFSFPIALLGTGVPGTGDDVKATQGTFTFRTDQGGIFKLVFLDMIVSSWEKITSPTNALVSALVTHVLTTQHWMAGRDGGDPRVFLQRATTLNERLRRSYRMN